MKVKTGLNKKIVLDFEESTDLQIVNKNGWKDFFEKKTDPKYEFCAIIGCKLKDKTC